MSSGDGPLELLEEFHRRQVEMYAGGAVEPIAEMLDEGVVWHVPGSSPIAGDHTGRDAVLTYFRRRREIAANALRLHPGDAVASGELVVQLVDGTVELPGGSHRWSTAGVYRFSAGRVAEAWLVPAELEAFDRVWKALAER